MDQSSSIFPVSTYITFATVPSAKASYTAKPRVSVIKTTKRHVIGRQKQTGTITVINPPLLLSFPGLEFYLRIAMLLRSPSFMLKVSQPFCDDQTFSRDEFISWHNWAIGSSLWSNKITESKPYFLSGVCLASVGSVDGHRASYLLLSKKIRGLEEVHTMGEG